MARSRNSNNAATDSPLPLLLHCPERDADGWEIGVNGKHPLRMVRDSELDSFLNAATTADWSSRNPINKREADLLLETVASGEKLMRKRGTQKTIANMPSYKKLETEGLARSIVDFCTRVRLVVADSKVVVWWSRHEKRFLLGLHCGHVPLRALYVLTVARLGQPGGFGQCENCGKPFRRRHKKEKRFCNPNCRSAFAMRKLRRRAREAEVRVSGKEHHGTRKAL